MPRVCGWRWGECFLGFRRRCPSALSFQPLRDDFGARGICGERAVVPVVVWEWFRVVGVWWEGAFFVLVGEVGVFQIHGCGLGFLLRCERRKVEPDESREKESTQSEQNN